MEPLEEKVLETIKKYKMLAPGDRVLIAVSGGPDSVALLHILLALKKELGLTFHIFHLDHMIRGEESRRDALYVKKMAEKLRLPKTILSFNVPVFASEVKLSLEEGARKVRYRLLENVSSQINANKIALGHQADDQAETILMRLIRGTGIEGLRGIPPVRDGKFVRPLIETTREEIETYLFKKNLKYRVDETNLGGKNLRSKIRYYLVPYLLAYNRNLRQNLLNMTEIVREEDSKLDELAEKKFRRIAREEGGVLKFTLDSLEKLPPATIRRVLRKAVRRIKGSTEALEFRHIEALEESIRKGEKSFSYQLPGGVEAFREYGYLIVSPLRKKGYQPSRPVELEIPGETELPWMNLTITAEIKKRKKKDDFSDAQTGYLDSALLELPLAARRRLPGDRFMPLGLSKEKKLQDFMVDCKIPRRKRDEIPLVLSGDRIVWVGGYRVDDRFRVTDTTENILILRINRKA